MFTTFQTLCLAAAAVLDTVLLLAVLERRNRRYVQTPVVLLILGGALWHLGAFCYALLTATARDWAAGPLWSAMLVMATGLLLMPSAMLHGVWRTHRTGLDVLTPARPRYLLAYLPMLALAPIGWRLSRFDATIAFLDRVWPFVPAYAGWLFAVNLLAAVGFRRLARNAETVAASHFFSRMAAVLVGLIATHAFVFLVALPLWPAHRPAWLLVVMLTPVAPAVVFAYYVLRYDFIPVVVERSLVYAAILAGGLVLHEVAIRPVTSQLSGRFGLNFALIEAMLVIGLIVGYSPLRQRAAEALRYLMGERVAPMRDRTRRMAVSMGVYAGGSPEQLLGWFCPALRDALRVRWVTVRVVGGVSPIVAADGEPALSPADADRLGELVRSTDTLSLTPRQAPSREALDQLRAAGAALVVRLHHRQIEGLLAVGRVEGNRELSDEEAGAALLLAEQLAVTLHAGVVQADRLAAERRAMQNEKLGALGLVASAIAHEVKNPLSSIRTIATLLAEELPHDDPKRQDVTIIRDEIDRLAATTSRLLKFARPAGDNGSADAFVPVGPALAATLHLMEYLARQKKVTIRAEMPDDLPPVAASEDALREIFTNLVANAVEAARSEVRVTTAVSGNAGHQPGPDGEAGPVPGGPGGAGPVPGVPGGAGLVPGVPGGAGLVPGVPGRAGLVPGGPGGVVIEIADDGAGLPQIVRDRLFEPFVTTRAEGTGLGLYIVGRRVRELGGSIRCETPAGGGTRFIVELPTATGVARTCTHVRGVSESSTFEAFHQPRT